MGRSFNCEKQLGTKGGDVTIFHLPSLAKQFSAVERLPYSLKILLENLLRREGEPGVDASDIEALCKWNPKAKPSDEIAFAPARVLLQDFTGVPAVVDLAAMRDAMQKLGGDPKRINPLQPVELVIDHSVQVDAFGRPDAVEKNAEIEFSRNRERYEFLKWGQTAFNNFRVVPPDTGIVHQVNIEYLARVVFAAKDASGRAIAYPDTLVGTDSHTTMVNGLGVLGWGVGGIEAEAAMLGQPVSMLIPEVVGFELSGTLAAGATATDLVLMVVEMLRKKGVVGKFVEFFGDGVQRLSLADRATIANMAPEYGATCGIFPIDGETLRYLELTGRSNESVALVEAYAKEQGMFGGTPSASYSDTLKLDLGAVEPSIAGPARPQDRIALSSAKSAFASALAPLKERAKAKAGGKTSLAQYSYSDPEADDARKSLEAACRTLEDGAIVIAAITSCTNTSNPSVLVAAGLVAKKAAERGLFTKPWVKTSLAPGSKVVRDYLHDAGLLSELEKQRFHLVGYGCTTCIGNSGPLPVAVSNAVAEKNLIVCSVLSGNRNFEGRVHAEVRANYLASPPLVVAYALAGRMNLDPTTEPLGEGSDGKPVYLKDIWPSQDEVRAVVEKTVTADAFSKAYSDVFTGDKQWASLGASGGDRYGWQADSTYVKHPPFFENMPKEPGPATDIQGLRALAVLGDSITTDHISPAGAIKEDSPAGLYLKERGVEKKDFNSYGSRRGNHEVMMRGTFANVRLRNRLAPGTEGGFSKHVPSGEVGPLFDVAMRYEKEGTPLCVLAGKEYGSGSSRDWAAKGPRLLGVRVVIAESYERIHRSNLVGMGVLPLEFAPGENVESLGLTGEETFAIEGLASLFASGLKGDRLVTVKAQPASGSAKTFKAKVRVDTPEEASYYQHGGILQYVLRQLSSG